MIKPKPTPRARLRMATGACLLLLAACTSVPRAELEVYLATGSATYQATDAVLDVIVPYERLAEYGSGLCGERIVDNKSTYCYERRSAFATIGDSPVVGGYRKLSQTVARFDRILAAYARGVSHDLLLRDLALLSESAQGLTSILATSEGPATAAAISAANSAIAGLGPLKHAYQAADDQKLRKLLLDNADSINAALEALAIGSELLWQEVVDGIIAAQTGAEPNPEHVERRGQIASLLANWSVMVDAQRDALGDLVAAVRSPDSLGSKLLNMTSGTAEAKIDAAVVLRQADSLGVRAP